MSKVLQSPSPDWLGLMKTTTAWLSRTRLACGWDSSGTLLASVTIPAGTSAPLDGIFRRGTITPVILGANTTGYTIAGLEVLSNTERIAQSVTQTIDSRITYTQSKVNNGTTTFGRPTGNGATSTGEFWTQL